MVTAEDEGGGMTGRAWGHGRPGPQGVSAGCGQASEQTQGGTGRAGLEEAPRGRRGRSRCVLGPRAAVTLELGHPHTVAATLCPEQGRARKARFICARPCADVRSCPFPIFLNILNERFYLFEDAKKK